MKKLLSVFILFAAVANVAMSQQFVHYEPVIVDRNTSSYRSNPFENSTSSYSQPRQQPQENLQTVNAYFVNQRGAWEKVRLRVRIAQSYGRTVVTARDYYDRTYDRWRNINSTASQVDVLDTKEVQENFDWKCYIQGYGYVYF